MSPGVKYDTCSYLQASSYRRPGNESDLLCKMCIMYTVVAQCLGCGQKVVRLNPSMEKLFSIAIIRNCLRNVPQVHPCPCSPCTGSQNRLGLVAITVPRACGGLDVKRWCYRSEVSQAVPAGFFNKTFNPWL